MSECADSSGSMESIAIKEEPGEGEENDDIIASSRSNQNSTSLPSSTGQGGSRASRNEAEKQRRDRLNGFISELSHLVPTVQLANKRLDKTSVLRLSANYLKIHFGILSRGTDASKWPKTLDSDYLLETMQGFLMILSGSGRIVFVSGTVEKFLGHTQVDLMGHPIYLIAHPEDRDILARNLLPSEASGRNFSVRLAERSLSRSEQGRWLPMSFAGQLRPWHRRNHHNHGVHHHHQAQLRGSPFRGGGGVWGSGTEDWLLFAVVSQTHSWSPLELSLYEAIQDEYFTRHNVEGQIIDVDQRISVVAGYTVKEVLHENAFRYIHQEDLPVALISYEMMLYNSPDGSGLVTYRLMTRSNEIIFLRSRGFLEYDSVTRKVESFFCINTLLR
ncbi:unnamed protein product [Darwinula stevensoni]|uniref:Uncharacterized protein n=1 Tax=Darwinula stevensoni TaxID=69355 RepID=A0A7R9A259_9CRUS|nr:unnamed protein product [Darwinula stevensoni]CAG0879176.1 unnamed protein product [Darwinula stevensoni]